MISEDHLNLSHVQYGNSCVMTAYALVANYFTRQDLVRPFAQYATEFKSDYESPQFTHHCREANVVATDTKLQEFAVWRICNGNGTIGPDRSSDHVLRVHQQSHHFACYKSAFDGEFLGTCLDSEAALTELLTDEEAIMVTGVGRHAVLMYHDGVSLKVRNPSCQGSVAISGFGDIIKKGIGWEVADAIPYRRRK